MTTETTSILFTGIWQNEKKINRKRDSCLLCLNGDLFYKILTLISGWSFAIFQFLSFWYYIILLAGGFGVQVGLYSHLKNLILGENGQVLAISGTTSTAAMVLCRTHYLANILPLIATSGAVAFVGQYQVELFWAGLVFNALGVIYILKKIMKYKIK